MCGIAGFNFSSEQLIRQMNKSLAHRGPDGEGIYTG
jgi:asparagine synthetase B (glutamine-hydrolysing)